MTFHRYQQIDRMNSTSRITRMKRMIEPAEYCLGCRISKFSAWPQYLKSKTVCSSCLSINWCCFRSSTQ